MHQGRRILISISSHLHISRNCVTQTLCQNPSYEFSKKNRNRVYLKENDRVVKKIVIQVDKESEEQALIKAVSPKENTINRRKEQLLERYDLTEVETINKMSLKEKASSIVENVWKVSNSISPRDMGQKQFKELSKEQLTEIELIRHEKLVNLIKRLDLKQFSVVIHRILVEGPKASSVYNKLLWKQIQTEFINRLKPTTNSQEIRSYGKIFYSLAKSKTNRNNPSSTITTSTSVSIKNFQTKFSILMPFASHQTFTMLVSSFSRMGPVSQEFAYIVESLYYRKREIFNIRQKIQIMYALTRNGREMDSRIPQQIDKMNLQEIILMLRCLDNCGKLFDAQYKINKKSVFSFVEPHILARKQEMNVIDICEICQLFFEATLTKDCPYKLSAEIENLLNESYEILRRNVNEVGFMKIWKHLPKIMNAGYMKIQFMEQVLKTMKILRKKNMFPQRIWKVIKESSEEFENLQIKLKIEKIE